MQPIGSHVALPTELLTVPGTITWNNSWLTENPSDRWRTVGELLHLNNSSCDVQFNTPRSCSKKVTRRSFWGLFWPAKRNRYNFWTIGKISTKFHKCFTYMVRNLEICEKYFFPRWRPTWPPKCRIECISALLSNTETNKVSIHIKWRS